MIKTICRNRAIDRAINKHQISLDYWSTRSEHTEFSHLGELYRRKVEALVRVIKMLERMKQK